MRIRNAVDDSRSTHFGNCALCVLTGGSLRPDYMSRLERILDRADELGIVAIVNSSRRATNWATMVLTMAIANPQVGDAGRRPQAAHALKSSP
jgi:hypothetical protein